MGVTAWVRPLRGAISEPLRRASSGGIATKAPGQQHRFQGRRPMSLAGMPPSSWVVAPYGLTRRWSRIPQLRPSLRRAAVWASSACTHHDKELMTLPTNSENNNKIYAALD